MKTSRVMYRFRQRVTSRRVRPWASRLVMCSWVRVDPHKLSATIEVVDHHERRVGAGGFTADQAGYTAMRTYSRSWPERVWAVKGASGAGRPLAQRLLEAREHVVDVPAKLAARVRLFDN